ncbi:MAG TPA: amino acid adenylation domain-containing protein, partial [Chthoniobacterales bacterium]|nr:amino acid adenylation domain-containing protein [Chthoniobacterales bacterium]
MEYHGREWTYRQLNQRANQLACHLRKLGVGLGTLVGLAVERSPELIISLLAILKAGAAYVPLDRDDPSERISRTLADAGLEIVIAKNPDAFAEALGVPRVIMLETEWPLIVEQSQENLATSISGKDAAYVIYTSGSTGAPKGVIMEHRSLTNLLWWHHRSRSGSCRLRTLQFCTVSFDFSFHEIFSTLAFGGTLVLLDDKVRCNPLALAAFVRAHSIERLFLPVTALNQFAEVVEENTSPAHLREVITTGEQLRITPAMVRLFKATGARLHNHYGATEFQDATSLTLEGNPATWPALPSIGYPISNVQAHILDPELKVVPVGTSGELCISGMGVARGYLREGAVTQGKFVSNPFGQGYLYRTGDLGRYMPDGAIEILGRADFQIKINGVRIEPGEIETILAEHPSIQTSVLHSLTDDTGYQRIVAYVVPSPGTDFNGLDAVLHSHAAARLPRIMQPETYVILADLPLTPSGKLDRNRLPKPQDFRRTSPNPMALSQSELESFLASIWREALRVSAISVDDNFFDLGATSLLVTQIHKKIVQAFGIKFPATTLYEFPTISALARHLSCAAEAKIQKARHLPGNVPSSADSGIAIIGMAGRFPGAVDLNAFWQNLCQGTESISFFSDTELEQHDPALRLNPHYVKAAAILHDVEWFDAGFFGISSKEAAMMDPQHRLMLECAWEALENAGYDPDRYPGSIGVYAGSSLSTYLINCLNGFYGYSTARPFIEANMDQFLVKLGNDRNYLPTRISYKLNLQGPSVNVQTACSTALVAVHLACNSLRLGECTMALAGGISIIIPQKSGYLYESGMIRSPDGHCRAFDAQAEGTLFGSGGGLVLLKCLDAALADGDQILAVIKGSAVNNDGSSKVGFTTPSLERQAEVIQTALTVAFVDPSTVTYVETHGTATKVGDPIEIAALSQAFQRSAATDLARQYCRIGSVKTNIGHLDEAAGIAGLIKTVLALQHRFLPPSLHFEHANPEINFETSPFLVNAQGTPWAPASFPRRAGVSSFGMGGTNCHVVLEEAPGRASGRMDLPRCPLQILTLSAKNDPALRSLVQRYVSYLTDQPDTSLEDVCFTASTGRKRFGHRLAICGNSIAELRAKLISALDSPSFCFHRSKRKIAFVFPATGALRGLAAIHAGEPAFRAGFDRCAEILTPLISEPLISTIQAGAPETTNSAAALFAVEYAMSGLWRSWGIEPDVIVGFGPGEYLAACLSGVFSVEDALRLLIAHSSNSSSSPVPPRFSIPHVKLISALTGQLAGTEIATPEYWQRSVRTPESADTAIAALRLHADLCLEVGAASHLATGTGANLHALPESWLPGASGDKAWQQIIENLCVLDMAGLPIDWIEFHRRRGGRRIPLPTYPWTRQRYWLAPPVARDSSPPAPLAHPLLGTRMPLAGSKELRFQSTVSRDSPPWLADHHVFN